MFEEDALLHIFIDKMPMELECPNPGCNHGEGGARWKTQPLSEAVALEMWKAHRADAHGQQIRGVVGKFLMVGLFMMVGLFVMMGWVELFVMLGIKVNFLSGPGQAQISKRYRAQCSKEDAVRKTSISSEGNGWGMSGTTRR